MKKEKINYLIGIVIYKEKLTSSSTLISMVAIADYLNDVRARIVIWDNSPEIQSDIELKNLKKFNNIIYKHTPENLSLAKVYNSIYSNNIKFDLLFLFDQDSHIDLNYFSKIIEAKVKNPNVNLFLPIIKSKDLIVSPANRYYVVGRYWKKEKTGLVNAHEKLAITSGMAISEEYLVGNHPCFNEDLNLYGIDTDFMIQYEKQNKYFFVVDYVMEHHLSFFEHESIEKKYLRFKDHKESILKIFKKESRLQYFLARIMLFTSGIKLVVKHKDLIFLK
ncbi:hypothetical protein [uncultured Maribacter sp.]|uniref:hypothetical protein n=1 Tax=uncultured Maribacter sp. TaxID=431308 RepID=UPI0030EB8F97|tara:strand:+ start:85167 stop:85997 length:831 start_codon:yes stop_codon:yes gene_type:complete